MQGSFPFWLRRVLMALIAIAVGYAAGNHASDAPRPEAKPGPAPVTAATNPKHKESARTFPDFSNFAGS